MSDLVLDDLADRLAATRFPDEIDDTGWDYGVPIGYLRELVEYWRDGYDWRAHEAAAERARRTSAHVIDGQQIHFVHAAVAERERDAAAPRARLAGLDRRVPRRHPEADRSARTTAGAPRTRST